MLELCYSCCDQVFNHLQQMQFKPLGCLGSVTVFIVYDISCQETSEPEARTDKNTRQQTGQHGLGMSVSVMANTDRVLTDAEKTVFDWCQEGNVPRVRQLLADSSVDINSLDQEVSHFHSVLFSFLP